MRRFSVRCSCGRVANIDLDEAVGRYVCNDNAWQFVGGDDERLWNCGEPGHYQAGVKSAELEPGETTSDE
jgi:hypothetical protein